MTAPPKVDVTFRKQKRKNGWFLIEEWEGRKGALEYGPMPEAHIEPLMNQIVAQHEAMAQASVEAANQNLAAMARPAAPRGFNPQQESTWLKQQRKKPPVKN